MLLSLNRILSCEIRRKDTKVVTRSCKTKRRRTPYVESPRNSNLKKKFSRIETGIYKFVSILGFHFRISRIARTPTLKLTKNNHFFALKSLKAMSVVALNGHVQIIVGGFVHSNTKSFKVVVFVHNSVMMNWSLWSTKINRTVVLGTLKVQYSVVVQVSISNTPTSCLLSWSCRPNTPSVSVVISINCNDSWCLSGRINLKSYFFKPNALVANKLSQNKTAGIDSWISKTIFFWSKFRNELER